MILVGIVGSHSQKIKKGKEQGEKKKKVQSINFELIFLPKLFGRLGNFTFANIKLSHKKSHNPHPPLPCI